MYIILGVWPGHCEAFLGGSLLLLFFCGRGDELECFSIKMSDFGGARDMEYEGVNHSSEIKQHVLIVKCGYDL